MIITNRLKNQHLIWRAAFGPMAENAASLETVTQKSLWKLLLDTSSKEPQKIEVARNLFDGMYKGVKEVIEMEKAGMDTDEKKERQKQMRQQSKEDLKNLNIRWLEEMINSEAQLREKMSLFWHGHFACRVINSYFQQELLHSIRVNALGNFGNLLKEVSKSPAMLQFLNNQQNRKKKPNENFAREVMELFTMGRGQYTENDIKEAARAFTGWGFALDGTFVFRQQLHDEGSKTFLGQTGNFNGDDILNILLEQPQTAVFITRKIYRYFVNEKPDDDTLGWLSKRFYDNNYDITKLLEDIFTSEWFYAEKNIGNRIKSPVELLAGIRRFLPVELNNVNAQLLFQKVLGQVLFFPPNVAGWPGGKNWIDSSTLMVRLRLPGMLAANEVIDIRAKNDDDVNMGRATDEEMRITQKSLYAGKDISGTVDWSLVNKVFEKTPREKLSDEMADILLQTAGRPPAQVLNRYADAESRDGFIKTMILNLMSTPEYQLC